MRNDVPVSVIAINLDQDADRLARLSDALAGQTNIAFQRMPALRGSLIPRVAAGLIPGGAETAAGTLGCFLSHIRAWEVLLESSADSAIILEDDAIIRRDLAQCHDIARRSGADVVFLNNRMALPAEPDQPPHDPYSTMSVADAVLARAALNQIACGADGYYLTRQGATSLIEVVRRNGICGDVDWFVLFCTIGANLICRLEDNQTFARKLRAAARFYPLAEPALTGAVLKDAAVFHGSTRSSRLQENAIGVAQHKENP